MPAPLFLQLESEVARIHRSACRAVTIADSFDMNGVCSDLESIAEAARQLQEDLLRNPMYRRARQNLSG